MEKIKMPTKLLKGKKMVDYWNNAMTRIGKSVFYCRDDENGLTLVDNVWNAIVFCHYKDAEKKLVDWIRLM